MLEHADVVYYPDSQPGIRRKRRGTGFSYIGPDGTTIDNKAERERLSRLGVPPAYTDVWICPLINGHLQATGLDSRARKQYRYHPDWSKAQSTTKFSTLVEFGQVLPFIRRRVARDLTSAVGDLDFALAAAVFLIDRLSLRVGNRDYEVHNGSYGALTLKRKHVRLGRQHVDLNFTAKGGKQIKQRISDGKLLRILQKTRDLPGSNLLSWLDASGESHVVRSSDLNGYLSSSGDGVFTAKTFRTWAGTVAAFDVAMANPAVTITDMAKAASARLHNTPTIARSSYIHPAVLNLASGEFTLPEPVALSGLTRTEGALLGFLQKQADVSGQNPPEDRNRGGLRL